MDNIYRIENCSVCGREIRSKLISKYACGTDYNINQFEPKTVNLIMIGANKQSKNWTLCLGCADAIESAINEVSDKYRDRRMCN